MMVYLDMDLYKMFRSSQPVAILLPSPILTATLSCPIASVLSRNKCFSFSFVVCFVSFPFFSFSFFTLRITHHMCSTERNPYSSTTLLVVMVVSQCNTPTIIVLRMIIGISYSHKHHRFTDDDRVKYYYHENHRFTDDNRGSH